MKIMQFVCCLKMPRKKSYTADIVSTYSSSADASLPQRLNHKTIPSIR